MRLPVPPPLRSPRLARPRPRLLPEFALLVCTTLLLGSPSTATADDTVWPFWVTDGEVHHLATNGTSLYLAGSFTRVAPQTGGGVPFGLQGEALAGFPRVRGTVSAIVSDGVGGWFLGGTFDSIGGVARANLAHLDAALQVTTWNPGADGAIGPLARDGDRLFVAGEFSTLGGQPRGGLGVVHATTGEAEPWGTFANDVIWTLEVAHGRLYAGGFFTTIGGQARPYAAALDPSNGGVLAWNPAPNSIVFAIEPTETAVYLGGAFTMIGTQPRPRLGEVSVSTALATAWAPQVTGIVRCVEAVDSLVYVAGYVNAASGQTRRGVVAFHRGTGLVTAWDPDASTGTDIDAIALTDSVMYVAGSFATGSMIGGQTRRGLAALDLVTGAATPWGPITVCGGPTTLALGEDLVYVGGSFRGVGGVARAGLAALHPGTGEPRPWSPSVDGTVSALAYDDSRVYVGGSFTTANGAPRAHLAAFDAVSGVVADFDPSPDGPVYAVAPAGSIVYAGGAFDQAGGAGRANLAALDAETGVATAWNPGASGDVYALAASPGEVYVGGRFAMLGGEPRANLGAVDRANGAATAWNPGASDVVTGLDLDSNVIYASGGFSTTGGQSRPGIAALDLASGLATPFNPVPGGGAVTQVLVSDGRILLGGRFFQMNGEDRFFLAEVDPTTGANLSSFPAASPVGLGGYVNALAAVGARIYVADQECLVALSHAATVDAPPSPTIAARGLSFLGATPNPFAAATTLAFELPRASAVTIEVFDVAGRLVATPARTRAFAAGRQSLAIDAKSLVPGVYHVRVLAGAERASGKVVVLP